MGCYNAVQLFDYLGVVIVDVDGLAPVALKIVKLRWRGAIFEGAIGCEYIDKNDVN